MAAGMNQKPVKMELLEDLPHTCNENYEIVIVTGFKSESEFEPDFDIEAPSPETRIINEIDDENKEEIYQIVSEIKPEVKSETEPNEKSSKNQNSPNKSSNTLSSISEVNSAQNKHTETEIGQNAQSFECQICSRTFSKGRKLTNHNRTHESQRRSSRKRCGQNVNQETECDRAACGSQQIENFPKRTKTVAEPKWSAKSQWKSPKMPSERHQKNKKENQNQEAASRSPTADNNVKFDGAERLSGELCSNTVEDDEPNQVQGHKDTEDVMLRLGVYGCAYVHDGQARADVKPECKYFRAQDHAGLQTGHMRRFHGAEPYCCILCFAGFKTQYMVSKHIAKQHPNQKYLTLMKCPFAKCEFFVRVKRRSTLPLLEHLLDTNDNIHKLDNLDRARGYGPVPFDQKYKEEIEARQMIYKSVVQKEGNEEDSDDDQDSSDQSRSHPSSAGMATDRLTTVNDDGDEFDMDRSDKGADGSCQRRSPFEYDNGDGENDSLQTKSDEIIQEELKLARTIPCPFGVSANKYNKFRVRPGCRVYRARNRQELINEHMSKAHKGMEHCCEFCAKPFKTVKKRELHMLNCSLASPGRAVILQICPMHWTGCHQTFRTANVLPILKHVCAVHDSRADSRIEWNIESLYARVPSGSYYYEEANKAVAEHKSRFGQTIQHKKQRRW